MPEPAAEPALSGLRLNLRIVSVVIFNFASYLTIGLPLAVLPGYVHDVMGFSAFWAGLVISLQYFATLLSRPHAGRYADLFGPKSIVITGLCGCFLSGLSYLLAATTSHWPLVSLVLLYFAGKTLWSAMASLFLFFLSFEFVIVSFLPVMSEVLPRARATLLAYDVAAHAAGRGFGALIASTLYAFGFSGNVLVSGLLALISLFLLSRVDVPSDKSPVLESASQR